MTKAVVLAEEALSMVGQKLCACGCGKPLHEFDRYGRQPKFHPGHNAPWFIQKQRNSRAQ